MRCQSLPPIEGRRKKYVLVVIIIIWMIMTIKTGSAWLTPMEIAFMAMILGQPSPCHTAISD